MHFGEDTNIQSVTGSERFKITMMSITAFLIKDNLVNIKSTLSNRTFCSDGNVLYLYCPLQ